MPIRHSKTRSGCRVCKRKRLKCDETTPACLNCVRRGIECPGYPKALRWSTKHEALGKYDRGQSSSTSPPPSIGVASTAETPDTYFSKSTTPSLSFQTSTPATFNFDSPTATFADIVSASNIAVPFSQWSRPPLLADDIDFLQVLHDFEGVQLQPGTDSHTAPACATLSPENTSEQSGTPCNDHILWDSKCDSCTRTSFGEIPLSYTETPGIASPFSVVADPWEAQTWPPGSSTPSGNDLGLVSSPRHIPAGLNDPSTLLVEFWFRSVCEGWAAYDSPSNPFRQLCASLWTTSSSVYYSIQSMAAASLPAEHSPNIQQIVLAAPEKSTKALIGEIQSLFHDHNAVITLPAGLLVSLFCMSSSVSWIDSRQLGTQYLRNARAVVELLDLKIALLSRQDRDLLEFFRGCLIYEEMLRSIVSDDEEDFSTLANGREPLPASLGTGIMARGLVFHSWTGVPVMICWLLGKVMVLSRRSRTWQGNASGMMREAKILEERLLAIDTSNIADIDDLASSTPELGRRGSGVTTNNLQASMTKPHLHLAAEAFRLCALLQLYQAFPELVSLRLPFELDNVQGTSAAWLNSLALHIVDILEEIPPTSGMRCLQPLLCICAGTALEAPGSMGTAVLEDRLIRTPLSTQALLELTVDKHNSLDGCGDGTSAVQDARDFLRGRLHQLEHLLPRKPVMVAGELLEEIWTGMDRPQLLQGRFLADDGHWTTPDSARKSSWLDIIGSSRFQSVFG